MSTSRRSALFLVLAAALGAASPALAQPGPAPQMAVPDAVLAAAADRRVTLVRADGVEHTGTVLAYDPATITIVEEGTGRLVAVPRGEACELRLAAAARAPAVAAPADVVVAASARPPKVRHVGIQLSQGPGNLLLDHENGRFYGFIGTSIGYPLIFEGKLSRGPNDGDDQYLAAVVGLGASWKVSARSNWRFDLGGTLTPTLWGGFSMGIGISAGFHYTSPNGFTVGFKVPVFGVAPGCNVVVGERQFDPTTYEQRGCAEVKTGAQLIGNYYLQAGMSLPILSVGYRF
jgi:hypothetical protein